MKIIILLIVLLTFSHSAFSEVSGYEITSEELFADGKYFGSIGQYQQITGKLFFTIDPENSNNRIIVDIDKAPLNSDGLIEVSADFVIRAPINPENGNDVALIDIPNRGRTLSDRFNLDLDKPQDDGFLMEEGYSMIWIGWEEDIETGIRADLPRATDLDYPIAGLGFTLARDIGSWIKYSDSALTSSDYLMAFGISQSGRFLRDFIYLGFNTDEGDRKAYDGIFAHVAGASRIDANRPDAVVVDRGQFNATSYPFADNAYPDPVSGVSEGLLENSRANKNMSKIFYTNGSNEYWGGGRVAALVHASPDGSQDISIPENVRFYFLAGSEHSPATSPSGEPVNG